jgi:plasmid maintenance system antidote protein VapI
MSKVTNLKAPAATACKEHPAYEASNCPVCGTAAPMGTNATRKVAAAAKASTTTKAKAPAQRKAPAKAASKATTKAPAKAPAKAAKAPAKRSTKASGPTHPGAAWLTVLDTKGLSQSEAARQMGVAPMTLNRLLNGHGIPTAKVAVAFARVTEQEVKVVWQQVADYELALVLAGGAK